MNRTRISRLLSLTALAVIGVVFSSSVIWAQTQTTPQPPPPADTLKVNYFTYANTCQVDGQAGPRTANSCTTVSSAEEVPIGVPDATLYISNPGTNAPASICAMIYVVDPFQEVRECCGCSLSPDSLRTISVNSDLTSNSNTAGLLPTGTIEIISSTGAPSCNPAKTVPTPAIRAWGTHMQAVSTVPGLYITTETDSQDATLSTWKLTHLKSMCSAILSNSSGYGVCTCGTGD